MEALMDLLKGFTPEGGTFGNVDWTTTLTGEAEANVVAGDRKQYTRLTVNHHLWVYFADAAPKPVYYVVHHMEVDANANTSGGAPLADSDNARGFFNSSVRIAYRNIPSVSPSGTVRREVTTPRTSNNDFDALIDRPQIEMFGKTGTSMVFTPSLQTRNHTDKWTLNHVEPATWELYQREPWNAVGVDGPGGDGKSVPVPPEWIKKFFDGEFGRISEMPSSSFAPVTCDLVAVWKVDGNFTKEVRAATLKIEIDYRHRFNLFHNGAIGDDGEPRRYGGEVKKTDESKQFKLDEIAVKHGK